MSFEVLMRLDQGKIVENTAGDLCNIVSNAFEVCLITPVFNGSEYIDDTIQSVLSQSGDFILRYHVQDGGSNDDTLTKLAEWKSRIESGSWPQFCRKIVFTFATERDGGMYDAINKGFSAALPDGDNVLMGWIAADDRVAPGAFATIFNVKRQFPEIELLGGRTSLLDVSGSILGVGAIRGFSRACVAAGLHDGRTMPFIMQEGTFWFSRLWKLIGGRLDPRFRLAGDWDLWRRMAQHAPYFSIDSVLGFHRRRPGQLSEQMGRYYAEIDDVLSEPIGVAEDRRMHSAGVLVPIDRNVPPTFRTAYDETARDFARLRINLEGFRASVHASVVVRFNLDARVWEKLEGFGGLPGAPLLLSSKGKADVALSVLATSGLASAEGPYPELGLVSEVRWMRESLAVGEVVVSKPGRYTVRVRCRNWYADQHVSLMLEDIELGGMAVASLGNERDIELRVDVELAAGSHRLAIQAKAFPGLDRYLLILAWELEPVIDLAPLHVTPVDRRSSAIAARISRPAPDRAWPRISVVVPTRNQAQYISDTLDSILRQAYPNLELIVVDGASTDVTRLILERYAKHITVLISEPDEGQSHAINKGMFAASGEILTWLNSDDLFADGALHAAAFAFMTSGADIVAGVCDIFGEDNIVQRRHLPCVLGENLPLASILDLENGWLRGQFFHQPEVMFTRDIWERAGGSVDQALFYSMDYDLWARMAKCGARIAVIGRTIAQFRTHRFQKTSTVDAYLPELKEHAVALRQKEGLPVMPPPRALRSCLRIVLFNDYGHKYGAGLGHARLAKALMMAGHEVLSLAYADFDYGRPRDVSEQDVAGRIAELRPDLVVIGNLHSIRADFDLIAPLVSLGIPTIFYAHDQWIGTGRCGYAGECTRYLSSCTSECPSASAYPVLAAPLIEENFRRKRRNLAAASRAPFAVLTNSNYMRNWLTSALPGDGWAPVHVVPIGLETDIFTLGDRWRARMLLGLPQDKFILMTAAANVADVRKGMPLLLDAISLLPDPENLLLIVMGFGSGPHDLPCEVRYTGYLSQQEIIALHYHAADLFVGPSLEEAFGQTYIEAAACGIPSVAIRVGGTEDAIIHRTTGLLIDRPDRVLLAEALKELWQDDCLRRNMGTAAHIHATNSYSLEVSAARLLAVLANEERLSLDCAPNVSFTPGPSPEPDVTYIVGPNDRDDSIEDRPCWVPLQFISTEDRGGGGEHMPAQFWWTIGTFSRLLLKADTAGQHNLHLRYHNDLSDQLLGVSANGGNVTTVGLPAMDLVVTQEVILAFELNAGWNRIDLTLAKSRSDPTHERDLGLLIEDLSAWPSDAGRAASVPDSLYELLTGFSPIEAAVPDTNLPAHFNWAFGPASKLRIFSAKRGRRHLALKVRNSLPAQRLTISVAGKAVGSRVLATTTLEDSAQLVFEAEFGVGFHPVVVSASAVSAPDSGGRSLSFMLEDICFVDEEDVPYSDEIRWDCSVGFSAIEPATPALGLAAPFRWLIQKDSMLAFERAQAGSVRFRLIYRTPIRAQYADVRINGQTLCRQRFRTANHLTNAEAVWEFESVRGWNELALDFGRSIQPEGDSRDLCLLIEDLTIVAIKEPSPRSDDDVEWDDDWDHQWDQDDVEVPKGQSATWTPGEGLGELDGPYESIGVVTPFRWATAGLCSVIVHCPSDATSLVEIAIRNELEGQTINVLLGGQIVAHFAPVANLAEVAAILLPCAFGPGDHVIQLQASRSKDPIGDEDRSLAFMLVDIGCVRDLMPDNDVIDPV
ncbi:glycosyltransferase [Sphingomonas montanisoli]|uniref:Glycosyltransferase n=1 Tax=Sphingomonas montanisoli TaxID=2606412 RepID=A0A5D9C9J2_9SPHN|nr:glycosyltransferase [Sphingomonas montanisoli]TZG27947.1 glycosyltransferase [Sphingomonas montanisoli]